MSGTLADTYLGFAKHFSEIPKTAAETAQIYSQIPLNQAQAEQARASAEQAQAYAEYYRTGLTPKTQLEAEQKRLLMPELREGLTPSQKSGSNTGYRPADEAGGDAGGGSTPPPSTGGGGGGRNIGPGTVGKPGETSSDLTAFAAPVPEPGSRAAMLAAAGPQPTTQAPIQVAQADTGIVSDTGQQLYSPGYQPVAQPVYPNRPQPAAVVAPGQAPPASSQMPRVTPETPLGVGGTVTAGDGSIMLGQAVAQPVTPGAQPVTPGAQPRTPPQQAQADRGNPDTSTYFKPLGIVVPRGITLSYWNALMNGQDTAGPLKTIMDQRKQALLQYALPTTDAQSWRTATERAYDAGWLSDADYAHIHSRYDEKPEFIRKLQPEETQRQNEAMAQKDMSWDPRVHDYVPNASYHSTDNPQVSPLGTITGPTFTPNAATPMQRAAGAGGAPGGGTGGPVTPPATPPGQGGSTFDNYKTAIHTHEGDSPTMGPYGFIPSSKVAGARKYAPDEVAGLTDAQIVQKQLSPQGWDRVLQGFTADNAVKLTEGGMRASAANLGMSHYIGAQGVLNLRKVSPDTTMAEMERRGLLTPGSVAGNPELQGNTTVRGFVQWAQGRYGNHTMTPDDISGKTMAAPPGGGGGVGGGPGGGTGTTAKPEFAPGTPEIIVHNIQTDNKAVDTANEAAIAAQGATRTVQDMLDRTPRIQAAGGFGHAAEFRTQAASLAHLVTGVAGESDFSKKVDSFFNFERQADREAFIKEATQLALQQEAQLPGVRSGIGIAAMVGKGSPSLNMQGDTVTELLNRMLVGHMMTQDYARGLTERTETAQQEYNKDPFHRSYTPTQRQYDREWTDPKSLHSANVYLGASTLLTEGGLSNDWKKRLSPEQQVEAVKLAVRANPDWVPGKTTNAAR